MQRRRKIEFLLNDKTLQDLIAVHLQRMCVIESSEDVIDVSISAPDKDGVRTLRLSIEPDIQTIYHT